MSLRGRSPKQSRGNNQLNVSKNEIASSLGNAPRNDMVKRKTPHGRKTKSCCFPNPADGSHRPEFHFYPGNDRRLERLSRSLPHARLGGVSAPAHPVDDGRSLAAH